MRSQCRTPATPMPQQYCSHCSSPTTGDSGQKMSRDAMHRLMFAAARATCARQASAPLTVMLPVAMSGHQKTTLWHWAADQTWTCSLLTSTTLNRYAWRWSTGQMPRDRCGCGFACLHCNAWQCIVRGHARTLLYQSESHETNNDRFTKHHESLRHQRNHAHHRDLRR